MGSGKRLRYLCQDETRLGLKTEMGRVITARGVKLIVKVQWPRKVYWLYGVLEPLSGWHFCQEHSHPYRENFQKFLDPLSQELDSDMAIIQMYRASAHQAWVLDWPENIIPIFQPSHSLQLNQFERLWQFIKRQFKGEKFLTIDQLRQRVQHELAQLSSPVISFLTSYNFILEALFHQILFYANS